MPEGTLLAERAASHAQIPRVPARRAGAVPSPGGRGPRGPAAAQPSPRPPGGARTAQPPARGGRRLADPFAPSEETKYTFVRVPARVRVRRRTRAGLSVRSPPGLTFLPLEHALRGCQDPHRLLPERGASPAAAVACGLRFPRSRQGGKRARGSLAPGLGAAARPGRL